VVNEDNDRTEVKSAIATVHDGDNKFSIIDSLTVDSTTEDESADAMELLKHVVLHPVDGSVLTDIEDVAHEHLPMDADLHHSVLKSMCADKGFSDDDCHVAASAALNTRTGRAENEALIAQHHQYKSVINTVALGFFMTVATFLLIAKFTECGSEMRRFYSTHVAGRRARNKQAVSKVDKEFKYYKNRDKKGLDKTLTSKMVRESIVARLAEMSSDEDTPAAFKV